MPITIWPAPVVSMLNRAFNDQSSSYNVYKAQVGVVALQLAQLLSELENAVGEQAVFNAAAVAWNKEVTDSYNYSSNPDNKGSVGPITTNQLVGIASSEGYPMDGMGPGGWPA